MLKTFHFQNGKCDQLLATDVVKQLQTHIHYHDKEVKPHVYGDIKGWDRKWKYSNCWYRTYVVTIGNDEFIVMALRSYDTIVGFIFNEWIYEVGKYSLTTTNQFQKYFLPLCPTYNYQYYDKAY